jgi:hypothetical protein
MERVAAMSVQIKTLKTLMQKLPARERPADEDQRPHPQGPEEDRRPRQEGQVMAPPRRAAAARGRTRRRVKKNIAIGRDCIDGIKQYEKDVQLKR